MACLNPCDRISHQSRNRCQTDRFSFNVDVDNEQLRSLRTNPTKGGGEPIGAQRALDTHEKLYASPRALPVLRERRHLPEGRGYSAFHLIAPLQAFEITMLDCVN